jgi:hypothetical protein
MIRARGEGDVPDEPSGPSAVRVHRVLVPDHDVFVIEAGRGTAA